MSVTASINVPDLVPGVTATINATASSSTGTITAIDLLVNGCVVASRLASPATFQYKPECGRYVFAINAYDDAAFTGTSSTTKVLAPEKYSEYWNDLELWSVPVHHEDVSVDTASSELVISMPASHFNIRVHNKRQGSPQYLGTNAYTESPTIRFPISCTAPSAGQSYSVMFPGIISGTSYEDFGPRPALHVSPAGIRPTHYPEAKGQFDGSILLPNNTKYIVELGPSQFRILALDGTTVLADSGDISDIVTPRFWPTSTDPWDSPQYRFGGFMLVKQGVFDTTVRVGRTTFYDPAKAVFLPDLECSFSSTATATGPIAVTFASTSSDVVVAYSIDGTQPLRSRNTQYCATSASVQITTSCIFKAVAVPKSTAYAHSYWDTPVPCLSPECSQYLRIGVSTQTTPPVLPAAGTYMADDLPVVVILKSNAASTIHYTVDGSAPTASSTVFTHPIVLEATTTVRALATSPGKTDSAIVSTTYTISNTVLGNSGVVFGQGSALIDNMSSLANWKILDITTPFSVVSRHDARFENTGSPTGMRTIVAGRNALNDYSMTQASCLFDTTTNKALGMCRLGNSDTGNMSHKLDMIFNTAYFDGSTTSFYQTKLGVIGDYAYALKLIAGWDTNSNQQAMYKTQTNYGRPYSIYKGTVGACDFAGTEIQLDKRYTNIHDTLGFQNIETYTFSQFIVRCGRKTVGASLYTRNMVYRVNEFNPTLDGKLLFDSGWVLNTSTSGATLRPRFALLADRGDAYQAAAPVMVLGTFLAEKEMTANELDKYLLHGSSLGLPPLAFSYSIPNYGDSRTTQVTASFADVSNSTEKIYCEYRNTTDSPASTNTPLVSVGVFTNDVPVGTKPRFIYNRKYASHPHHNTTPVWSTEQELDFTYATSDMLFVTAITPKGITVSYKVQGPMTDAQLLVLDDKVHPVPAIPGAYYDKHFYTGPGEHKLSVRSLDPTTQASTQVLFDSTPITVVVPVLVDIVAVSASSYTPNIGQSVTFSSSVVGTSPNYLWDFGDGTTSTQAAPTKTYDKPGSYVVSLVVGSLNEKAFRQLTQSIYVVNTASNQSDSVTEADVSEVKVS